MPELTPEQLAEKTAAKAAFLEEYKALCIRYGMFVNNCGCCDPWVQIGTEGDMDFESAFGDLERGNVRLPEYEPLHWDAYDAEALYPD